MAFERRTFPDQPTRCGCPLLPVPCRGTADGEDRLCSTCRRRHRPDSISSDAAAELNRRSYGFLVDRDGNPLR